MMAIRAPVTTNDDCPMKIGQKRFCAVHDKHLFHFSFNEAQLIGAANSLVSENNPETIDSVRKSIKIRPFLIISENFRKENTETNQTKKTKKNKKHTKNKKTKKTKKTKKNKDLATSLPTAIFGQIFVFFFFFFLFFFVFFCFLCFLWFCWLLGLQSFVLCRKLVLNHWLQRVATKYTHHLF